MTIFRQFIITTNSISVLLLVSLSTFAQKADKPNIVFILTDQQSANAMSNAGNADLNTPAMDALADDGVAFRRAYCTFPICSPARASMLTGLMPHQTGNNANGVPIPDSVKQQTLGFVLKQNGYETYYGGKWHLPSYTMRGGDGFDMMENFGDDDLADKAVEYLKQDHEKPFFMMLSFDNPHNICEFARNQPMPWGEVEIPTDPRTWPNLPNNFGIPPFEPDIIRDYQEERPRVFPTFAYTPDDWRKYRYVYFRLVERVDKEIQKVIDALKSERLYDDALIIFSSDHGDGQGAHQWNQKTILYNESIQVPLILKLPDAEYSKIEVSKPVSAGLDIMPTIARVAGVKMPKELEGFDLLQYVKPGAQRPPVFVETMLETPDVKYRRYYYGYAIIKGDYKYVNYSQGKYREQLFHLGNDPGEMVNLAVESRHDDILEDFRELLVEWMNETDAPGIRSYVYNPDFSEVAGQLFR